MIKTVIFDLGNVIVPLDFPAGYRAISERCGIPAEDVPKRIGETNLVSRLECGQIESGDFMRELSSAPGLNVTEREFRAACGAASFPPTR